MGFSLYIHCSSKNWTFVFF